jgi:predicted O-linked N-acetylglucosamine transferase (SPINDLY family)
MMYVCTANFFSLATQFLVNIKAVKKALGIPILSEYEEQQLRQASAKKNNLMEDVVNGWKNAKTVSELKEREKLIERRFKDAGTSAPVRTFKHNPLETKKIPPK